jgi:hypothetical protein
LKDFINPKEFDFDAENNENIQKFEKFERTQEFTDLMYENKFLLQ